MWLEYSEWGGGVEVDKIRKEGEVGYLGIRWGFKDEFLFIS